MTSTETLKRIMAGQTLHQRVMSDAENTATRLAWESKLPMNGRFQHFVKGAEDALTGEADFRGHSPDYDAGYAAGLA